MKKNLRNKLTVDPPAPSGTGNAAFWRAGNRPLAMGAGTSTVLFLAWMLIFTACTKNDTAHEHDTYTCPMHPTVVSDRPGTCPVCGMDLVRKASVGHDVEITEDLAKLLRSPNETVVASVNTIKGEYKSVPVTIHAQGVVTYDTRNIYTIPARVGGRLERVYLKYEFQPVSKGQKVAEIYSPELITAQRELIFLLNNDPSNKALIEGARSKLRLMGMSTGQINAVAERKTADNTIGIYSPHSGYLITGQQGPSAPVAMPSGQSSGGQMQEGMGASAPSGSRAARRPPASARSGAGIIREGSYVNAGEPLFTIVNVNDLLIELNLPGSYTGAVKEGSKVDLDFGDGQTEPGTVDFIQPFFDQDQDFLKIRVYTKKTEGLHIGHLVTATIHLEPIESLWIPKEAVLDLGTQKVVFLKGQGVLTPKEVTTGMTSEGLIEIKNGLASSDEIAANAQFLVDSESFIKPVK